MSLSQKAWDSEVLSLELLSESSPASRNTHRHKDPDHAWLTILNNFQDPIALFDTDLRHVYVNEATAVATNIASERFRGRRMWQLGHPEPICNLIDSNVAEVFRSGEHRSVDVTFEGPEGTVYYQSRMIPDFDRNDHVQYVIVISRAQKMDGSSRPAFIQE